MAALNPTTRDYTAESLDAVPDAALEQAALIRLSTRRGTYWFDPTMGSHLYRLAREKDVPRAKKSAFDYAAEALAPLKDGRVVDIQIVVTQTKAGRLDLHISLMKADKQAIIIHYFVPVGG